MSDLIILTPNVLVGGTDPVARARAYVGRELGSEDGIEQPIVAALNGATGKIERRVNRGMRVRTYRNQVTISCDTTVDDQTLTAASGLLALKVDDDASGSSLALGSRIASITSDAALELTRKATSGDAMTVTFGSAPIILDGDATDYIYIPERPVVEVYSAKWVAFDGTKTALDTTGARLDKHTGRYKLNADIFPRGKQNIEIECKAGVTPGVDWDLWNHLEAVCLRLVQVMFQDYIKQVGRAGDINIVQFTQHILDFKLPEDIAEGLQEIYQPW